MIEVVYDEFGLLAGDDFESAIAASARPRMKHFLKAVVTEKPVLDWKLDVAAGSRVSSLHFSGAKAGKVIAIIATRERFEMGHQVPDLKRSATHSAYAIRRAVRKLETLKHTTGKTGKQSRDIHLPDNSSAQLLKVVAHDLRNPISGILAASQYLVEDAGHVLDANQVALLRSIEQSSEFALQFLEDMLELHATESGKLKLHLEPTEPAGLAAECIALHRQRAGNKRITLEAKSDGPVPAVNLDRRRVAQSVSVLIRSELERLNPGGRVEILTASRNDSVAIVVSGEESSQAAGGMKPILERMRRASQKKGLNATRTTLMLGAARRIVEAHHGTFRVERNRMGGMVVRMLFPISAGNLKRAVSVT